MKRSCFILASLLTLTLALHFYRLSIPARYIFDECYYVPAARDYTKNSTDVNWVHPPLAKYLISRSIKWCGDKPWAWRLPSVLASGVATLFFFLLAQKLFQSDTIASLASLLYLTDGITSVQSRIAMLDMIMVGFLVPALYFVMKRKYTLGSILLGLSLACKWVSLFSLPIFFIELRSSSDTRKTLLILLKIFVQALLVYYLIVRMLLPHQALPTNEWQVARKILYTHSQMLKFHLRPIMKHNYSAPWWKWVLLIRPIWYSYRTLPSHAQYERSFGARLHPRLDRRGASLALNRANGNLVQGIVALPNPFFWWTATLATLALIFKVKEFPARFTLCGFLSFTLPWIFSIKGGFMYYLLPASPFLALGLAYWLRGNKWGSVFVSAICIGGFVLFFPLYCYYPITRNHFEHLMWLHSWI